MARSIEDDGPTEQVVIRLEETTPRILGVRAIDLSVSSVLVRLGSVDAHGVDQVFQSDIARVVRSICDGAAHRTGETDHPDFCLRIKGLTIEHSTISVSIGEDGLRRFTLRFRECSGNVLAIFRLSPRQETGMALFTPRILSGPEDQLTSDKLFDDMLAQLYLPLLNLNSYLGRLLDGTTGDRGVSLSNSVVQLKARAEVMQFAFDSLISGMMVERFTADPPAKVTDRSAA